MHRRLAEALAGPEVLLLGKLALERDRLLRGEIADTRGAGSAHRTG